MSLRQLDQLKVLAAAVPCNNLYHMALHFDQLLEDYRGFMHWQEGAFLFSYFFLGGGGLFCVFFLYYLLEVGRGGFTQIRNLSISATD